ncbi:MAG TPA: SUMF1/EgtB/PvdO family nonheme iron enzyme, partial [Pyrinomonadaceae bacterium]|nr:SUMF1/EgtB/PvdO family nonheme iron enzyme [Pyrinomonadaceae bacterium]
AIVMKTLEKRRRNRYENVAALREDIDNFLKGKFVKARKRSLWYLMTKSISQFLGFKGGLTHWDEWKTPAIRLSVLAVFFILLGFIGRSYIQSQPLVIENKENQMQVPTFNEVNALVYQEIPQKNIFCDAKEKNEICFTFVAIPAGNFLMGRKEGEFFKTVYQANNSKPTELVGKFEPVNKTEKNINPQEKNLNSPAIDSISELSKKTLEKNPKITTNDDNSDPKKVISTAGTILEEESVAEPLTQINISKNFYMGKFEITNKQWNIVTKLPKVNIDLEVEDKNDSMPKTNISYYKAVEFCNRLTAFFKANGENVEIRLPSEAEWEYVCRAGNTDVWKIPQRTDIVNAMILTDEKVPKWTEPLMRKASILMEESVFIANSYGVVAMNGNVWEIVADDWHDNYLDMPDDVKKYGIPRQNKSQEKDKYVKRGGSYMDEASMTQCAYRTSEKVGSEGNNRTGFRIVMVNN